jgi:phosphate transporter
MYEGEPSTRRFSTSSNESNSDNEGHPGKSTLSRFANKVGLGDSITSSTVADNTVWTARSDYAYDTRLLYKRKLTTMYTSLQNLKSYVEINYSGFRKILKK